MKGYDLLGWLLFVLACLVAASIWSGGWHDDEQDERIDALETRVAE